MTDALDDDDDAPIVERKVGAALFEVTADQRSTLFSQENRRALARLKHLHLDVYQELVAHWKAIKMDDVRTIERTVDADVKQALKDLKAKRREKAQSMAVSSGGRMVDPMAPLDMAKAFVEDERPYLMWTNGIFLDWDGACYVELEETSLRSSIYAYLSGCIDSMSDDGDPIVPNKAMVTNVYDALMAVAYRDYKRLVAPCWIDEEEDDPDPRLMVSCQNGILHLPSGVLYPSTPRFFTYNAVDFAFEESWECGAPEAWLKFLDGVWGDTPENIDALQEIMGHLLIPDTSHQKIFNIIGPSRSGKGTIGRVIHALVGASNVDSSDVDALGKDFGMEALIGKTLMLVSDMRTGGAGSNTTAIVGNLLRISGEDNMSINRKFKGVWRGMLSTRILMLSNMSLRLPDQANALTARLIPLRMTRSFIGQEDRHLSATLRAEIAGIFNWAVEGYRRLERRGHFELTKTGREVIDEIETGSNPAKGFVAECCDLDYRATISKDDLYALYDKWQEENGVSPPRALNQFSTMLTSATNYKVGSSRPLMGEGDNRKQVPHYTGIKVKPEWESRLKALLSGAADF